MNIVPVTINDRWTINLPEHRATDVEWSHWEKARTAAVADLIRTFCENRTRQPVVYDIGSEQGDLPCLWSVLGAKVCLFEPSAHNWPNIRTTFEANGQTPHKTWHGFAGHYDFLERHMQFQRDGVGEWPMAADAGPNEVHAFCHLWERPDIPKITIDTFAHDPTTKPPDIINMDTEGSELRILHGAQVILQSHRPIVFVSIHPQFILDMYHEPHGDTAEGLHAFMKNLDYEGTHLITDHEEHWRFDPR